MSKANELSDAASISALVVSSPFAFAYPEWRETASDIRSRQRRRSTVTITRPQIEDEPEVEIQDNPISKARVQAAIDFMNANFHRRIVLGELGAVVNLSAGYFTRVFTDEIGIPPMAYLTKLRLERAGQLLKTSFLSIKQVMGEVGYNNKAHFSRHFKRHFWHTPSAYRKRFFHRR